MVVEYLSQLKASLINHAESQAFCIRESFYSYAALLKKVASIAHIIGSQNNNSKNIGVVVTDDLETYASLLACWFAGFAYVPLHPDFPKERNSYIANGAGIEVVLTSFDATENIVDVRGISVINTGNLPDDDELSLPVLNISERNHAYILFTSGSTGVPKGVPISHGNLNTFVKNFSASHFNISPSDKCLQMFDLTFDVSISSFLPALLQGACVYTVPDGIKYIEVLKLIRRYELTSLQIVPSILRLGEGLIKKMNFPWVRNCILTGEATSVDLLPFWRNCIINARIFNYYGPTESTIYCSFYEWKSDHADNYNGLLAIGSPMGSMSLIVATSELNEAASDEKGELLIAGGQLTEGYINNPQKNESSFLKLPGESQIYYRSGDLCYKDKEGNIFYCGRLDNQVKINGFRIELGEIEHLLRDHFKLNNVVVVSRRHNLPELICVVEETKAIKREEILTFLRLKLPEYMVPKRIEMLNQFPLGVSGKTDRIKIKELILAGE